jgi:hypothetical protein
MHFDVYYASQAQDKYGKKQKTWNFGKTVHGYAETLSSDDKSKMFLEYQGKLMGRTKEDLRFVGEENEFPITDILITNIRDIKTGVEYFLESHGERSGLSTLYEISHTEPFVDPFNRIEYWRFLFNRLDVQVLKENDPVSS